MDDLEESLELVSTMATCVQTLKVLSANLADASAIVARGPASIRPRLQACQLPRLVEEVVHNARLQLAVASGIHIVLEVDPTLPTHACIDIMRARQAHDAANPGEVEDREEPVLERMTVEDDGYRVIPSCGIVALTPSTISAAEGMLDYIIKERCHRHSEGILRKIVWLPAQCTIEHDI